MRVRHPTVRYDTFVASHDRGLWIAAVTTMLAAAGTLSGQTAKAIQRAGKIFENRCARCHVIPDPEHRTDRAWLDQVNRTA